MDDEGATGPTDGLKCLEFGALRWEADSVEFVTATFRRLSREHLEAYDASVDHSLNVLGKERAWRTIECEVDDRMFCEVALPVLNDCRLAHAGLAIGISKMVVTPPAAAAAVSDATVPRFG